jgi:hypothetical protein
VVVVVVVVAVVVVAVVVVVVVVVLGPTKRSIMTVSLYAQKMVLAEMSYRLSEMVLS